MEEDIKLLESQIQTCKECKFATCEQCEISWREVKAIENLKARNKKLEYENKTLKGFVSSIYNETPEEDYIPKSKVKEKIEELVNKIDGTNKGFIYACQVDLLEELIEDVSEKKKEYWAKYED